jgi:phosphohistidine phosphatase
MLYYTPQLISNNQENIRMKRLLLMRHAKSSWKDSELPDHERPLKKKGQKDAEQMGKMLKSKDLTPDLILTSSAARASQTAEIVAEASKAGKKHVVVLDALYMAEPQNILDAIREHGKDQKTVMVIGHNPGMEAFLQIANGGVESLPTAAIAYVGVQVDKWKQLGEKKGDQVKLKKLWRPKDLE